MDNGKNPFGVSFIQTSAGAMITGEIKRYQTYKQMMEETAPTRLATVANASRDHEQFVRGELDVDYAVPDEHVGGILYQRDFINSTWILLYTDADLSIPTFVEWDNILHVPAWVGGVSNNRVKLVQDSYAVPRTTYYSFGNYRLVLPPANHPDVKLGDEIVLEQYENYGYVLYEHVEGEYTVPDQETITTDDGKNYNVLFTVPYYHFEVDPGNNDPVYGQPITACAYKFICTETKGGGASVPSSDAEATRCWRPVIIKDNISSLITELRQRDTDHVMQRDPHPNYILKSEARNYLWTDVRVADEFNEGKVRLATMDDITNDVRGSIAVTPQLMKQYTTATFSVIDHLHDFRILLNVPFESAITESNKTSSNSIVTPVALVSYTLENYSPKIHTHVIADVVNLQTILDRKQHILKDGNYIVINHAETDEEPDIINCTIPNASTDDAGITKLITSITDENRNDTTAALTPAALSWLMSSSGAIWNAQNTSPYWGVHDDKYDGNGKCVHGRLFQSAIAANGSKGWIKFPLLTVPAFNNSGKRYCLAVAWGQSDIYYMQEGHLDLYITSLTGRKLDNNGTFSISIDRNTTTEQTGGIVATQVSNTTPMNISFKNDDLPFGYCKFYRIFTPITTVCPYYSITASKNNPLIGWPLEGYTENNKWNICYHAIIGPDGYSNRPATSVVTEVDNSGTLQFGGTFGHVNSGQTDVDGIEGIRFLFQKPSGEKDHFSLIGINWTVFGVVDADANETWPSTTNITTNMMEPTNTNITDVAVLYEIFPVSEEQKGAPQERIPLPNGLWASGDPSFNYGGDAYIAAGNYTTYTGAVAEQQEHGERSSFGKIDGSTANARFMRHHVVKGSNGSVFHRRVLLRIARANRDTVSGNYYIINGPCLLHGNAIAGWIGLDAARIDLWLSGAKIDMSNNTVSGIVAAWYTQKHNNGVGSGYVSKTTNDPLHISTTATTFIDIDQNEDHVGKTTCRVNVHALARCWYNAKYIYFDLHTRSQTWGGGYNKASGAASNTMIYSRPPSSGGSYTITFTDNYEDINP